MNPISLSNLAKKLEDDLNALLNNPEIKFKIWADAGEYQAFYREGNTVIWFINGNLRRVTSSNDANDLVMGVNGIALDFAVPITRPRTNALQTDKELEKIKDGQYPFVEYITGVINEYFEKAQSYTPSEGDNEYSVAFRAGMSTTGVADLVPVLGNCIKLNVFIELYYIQNGVNSKNIKLSVDGKTVPYKALRWGRAPVIERDIYVGSLVSKNTITSTAFSIDVDMPALNGADFDYVSAFLTGGKPNVAHFVTLNVSETVNTYFMTVNNAQTSAEGISVAGSSFSLMEVADGYFNVGTNHIGKFLVPFSNSKQITAQIDFGENHEDTFVAYVGGKCSVFNKNFVLDITPGMARYDKDTYDLYVYIVFPKSVVVTRPRVDGIATQYIDG